MTKHWMLSLAGFGLLLTSGCAKSGQDGAPTPAPAADTAAEDPKPAPTGTGTERPAMTDAECQAQGGKVVGDIGDGAIHKPDYVCETGKPPIGTIKAADGAPVAIEGSVCCPAAAP
jgi:hypothetical protein